MLSLSKYLFLSLFLAMLLHANAFSQKLGEQNIEQITLATDRDLYLSGEPIWYGGEYSVIGNDLLQLSKVVYVELFNNDNQVVASQKVTIDDGVITGRLVIPEHVTTGYYILRVYTRYQQNFPEWQFTSVILSVVNPFHPLPPIQLLSKKDQINMALMADGNIAFKISEPLTSQVDSVMLIVNQIQVKAEGSYYSNGLGSFNYKVKPNDNLSLLIIMQFGDSTISHPYPVGNMSDEFFISYQQDYLEIKFKSNSISNKQLEISILNIDSHELTSYNLQFAVDSALAKVPIEKIGKGLLFITMKNGDEENIAQALYYIPKTDILQKSIITNNSVLPDSPISIDISDINKSEYPLAISMVRRGSVQYSQNILPTYLIENPLYLDGYLPENKLNSKLLNQIRIALSLKHDYFISIKNDSSNNRNLIIPELTGITLQGKLVSPQTNNPVANEKVYVSVLGNDPQFHASYSNEDGNFVIPLNFCYDQQDIYMATNITDNGKIEIQIDNGFSPNPPPWLPTNFIPDTTLQELITHMYLAYQVNKSFAIQRQQTDATEILNRPFFGNNLLEIKLTDYIRMSSLPEVFNELVPNVRARKSNDKYELIVFDDDINLKYNTPLVLVDGVPYNDINKLMKVQPTEIERIDIINHEYIYGNILFKGIIMITTNTGNFADLPLSKGGVFVEYETLKPTVKFVPFSQLDNHSERPNFANTNYWGLIYNDSINEQLILTAPNSIAEYELTIVSLSNPSKILRSNLINVINKHSDN